MNSQSQSTPPSVFNENPPASLPRAVALWVGAVGVGYLAAMLPLLDRAEGQFVLKALDDGRVVAHVGWLPVLAAVAAAAIGGVALLWSLVVDARVRLTWTWLWRWVTSHPLLAGLAALSAAAGSVDVYELVYDPFSYQHGLRPWMLREDLQLWMFLAGAVMVGLGVSAAWPGLGAIGRGVERLTASLSTKPAKWFGIAALTVVVLGAVMNQLALEGIPHFSDSLTYLIQGRILQSGRLWVPAPKHPDLFIGSIFFLATDGRFYGKYPIGWPAILGLFDRLTLGFMANAVLAGGAAVLTGLVAGRFAPKRVAVLAAVLFGLSPWAWFNGSNFASHVAAACTVLGFLWLFLRAWDLGCPMSALGSGLFLGAAVLVRPFDAATFALPVALAVLYKQVTEPKRWLGLGTLIAVGALVGVGVYLWSNAQTTGAVMKSPYALENRWDKDWNPTPMAMLARLAFQWCELNGRFPGWGLGGLTVAILGTAAAGGDWRKAGLRITAASTLVFFLGCTAFGFTNVWWGPRWLFPAAPLLAIFGAYVLDQVMTFASGAFEGAQDLANRPGIAAGQLGVCVLIGGLGMGMARYGGQFCQNAVAPPHMVSSAVDAEARSEGIRNALVGMPLEEKRAPLDPRAGLVFMGIPIEENPVIYVRAVPGWEEFARECYPGRALYRVVKDAEDDKGFRLERMGPSRVAESESGGLE